MGEYSVKVGDQLTLTVQLRSGHVDKHVLCYIETDTGIPLSGSPFSIPHFARGKYTVKPPELKFPTGIEEVHATYIVYNDASYSEESMINGRSLDVWRKDPTSDVDFNFEQIIDLLNDIISSISSITASAEIEGEIIVEDELEGTVTLEILEGEIQQPEMLEGIVSGNDIDGFVSTNEIIGVILEGE